MLREAFNTEMPYNDPHTAAAALWALRHATGCEFEASVASVEGSRKWRKGLESVAIACYRQEHGRSPTVQFGRMPVGYRPSTGGSARKGLAHLRPRGGPSDASHERHQLGLPPVGPLMGNPQGERWGGHAWTPWVPLGAVSARWGEGDSGLYRIRRSDRVLLLYIGEDRIP
jgi:hypothetical protein